MSFAKANPVSSVPIKKREIAITAIDTYDIVSVDFMVNFDLLIYLLLLLE